MENLIMHDVGDGMHLEIRTIANDKIVIDCGSQSWYHRDRYYYDCKCHNSPDVFILSHFHHDHYNGLFSCLHEALRFHNRHLLSFENYYFPVMPQFAERTSFLMCLSAINLRYSPLQLELLKVLKLLNDRPFNYKALAKGDKFRVKSSEFEVIWPPRELYSDDEIIKSVRYAIDSFNNARNSDEKLGRIYEQINGKGISDEINIDKDIEPEDIKDFAAKDKLSMMFNALGSKVDIDQIYRAYSNKELESIPELTKKANDDLRKATNRLSLAFYEDNRFLFLGDLEEREIKQVVDHLVEIGRTHFSIIVAPHHGTHWHDSLEKLSCQFLLASAGKKMHPKIDLNYKKIADKFISTSLNGRIIIPSSFRYRSRYAYPFDLFY